MQFKIMGVLFLLRFGAICFRPSFLQKIPLVTHFPSYWEAGRCPGCSLPSRAAPTSLPSVVWVLLLWLLSRGRFVSRAGLWASCPAAASPSGAPPVMAPKITQHLVHFWKCISQNTWIFMKLTSQLRSWFRSLGRFRFSENLSLKLLKKISKANRQKS